MVDVFDVVFELCKFAEELQAVVQVFPVSFWETAQVFDLLFNLCLTLAQSGTPVSKPFNEVLPVCPIVAGIVGVRLNQRGGIVSKSHGAGFIDPLVDLSRERNEIRRRQL